jgi:hypothetical protein
MKFRTKCNVDFLPYKHNDHVKSANDGQQTAALQECTGSVVPLFEGESSHR